MPRRLPIALALVLAGLAGCGESDAKRLHFEKAAIAGEDPAPPPEIARPTEKDEIAWADSFDQARARAREAGSLVMVDFYTDWCGYCKKLDAVTYKNAEVVKLSADFAPVKLDAERDGMEVARAYEKHISGFPTVLFLDPSGDPGAVVGVIDGYLPPGPFADRMRQIAKDQKDLPAMERRLASEPEDLEAIGRLAAIYHGRGDDKRTVELIDRGEELDPENEKGHLTRAYLAAGSAFLLRHLADDAVPYFRKAARSARDPKDLAEARGQLAASYHETGKPTEAIAELRSIPEIPGVSDEDRAKAKKMLDQILSRP